jgi:DNA-binding NtrC family response regulator/tetratricopeptide (TPR) repeat protein
MASYQSSFPPLDKQSKQDILVSTIRSGHFREALDLLRGNPQLRGDLSNLALLAELQMRTGDLHSARDTAKRLLLQHKECASQIRCHFVLGTICRDIGKLDEARRHYERAIELAEDSQDIEQLCVTQIRLLSLHVAGTSVDVATILPTLRRNVQASGDPFLAIALHIFLAEAESRRGHFVVARQQLAAARSLLRDTPNLFLEGNAAIAAMCLSLLCSAYDDALRNGILALKCSEKSGDYRTALAARLNLGQVLLNQGRFREAEEYLKQALSACPRGGNSEIGVLDALAQVFLARGDTNSCEEFLGRIDDVLAENDLAVAYNRYWGIQTKLVLLGRLGRWVEAEALIATVGRTIPTPSDSSLRIGFSLAQAEIFLANDKLDEANSTICEVAGASDSTSLENQGRLERLLALYAAKTHPLDAPTHFERAFRIIRATGNQVSCLRLLDEYRTFLLCGALSKALKSGRTIEGAVTECGHTLNRISALHRFAEHPFLLGLEAFWLLTEAGCAEMATLAKDGKNQKLLLSSLSRSANSVRPRETAFLFISLDQDGAWTLRVRPRSQALSATCNAIAELVHASVTLGVSSQRRLEVDALKPVVHEADHLANGSLTISLRRIVQTSKQVASSTIPILITGETGTGKEVLARFFHRESTRSTKPFLAFNCATVPPELLDSQLFGHRRGAFTGAVEHFSGIVRAADGGTLFLDEIGDLSRHSQPKLLRFLESGEVYSLGDNRPAKVDVRIIAATNADIDRLVADGGFREDLFYRLNVIRYHIPPLRERREEIPALVDHFLKTFSEEFHKDCPKLSNEALDRLLLFSWPGNVRQLANEVRRAVALTESSILQPEQLSPEIVTQRAFKPRSDHSSNCGLLVDLNQPLATATEQLERAMLEHALRTTSGKIDSAARLLGLSRKGLFLKRHRLGIRSSRQPLDPH